MLASLFYTRAAPRELTATDEKRNDHKSECTTNAKDASVPQPFLQRQAVTNHAFLPGVSAPQNQRRMSHSGEFLSSADIFRIGCEDSSLPIEDESSKKVPTLDEKASLERIKPLLHGCLVRRRMKSRLGRLLIAKILELKKQDRVQDNLGSSRGQESSQRAVCLSHLVSFVEHGKSNSQDDEWQKTHEKKTVKLVTKPGSDTKNNPEGAKMDHHLSLSLYSSDKTQELGQQIFTSLQEAVGTKEQHIEKIMRDVTPAFLLERRSMFLRTIFVLEDSDGRFAQVPRLIVGDGSNILSPDRSLMSIFGGQYFQLIDNMNHICGASR
ncbi:uncharacterized protein Tco025E_07401 [Trypanosoma conorhini]|uniref:Uncharacterized protein n=1 Tax=Trypanosoma conorhini TaxID=83891 RepID=A0A3R7MK67_9TRYP|nr:uncharacterized protein Tco025E_07401 [Trypanosoma conorhini]RNF07297.1 hypothetical protein Tco025E_07401 [Trypanosoma conorhini]